MRLRAGLRICRACRSWRCWPPRRCSRCSCWLIGKSPATFLDLVWVGAFGTRLLLGQHADPRLAADPDRADGGDPGAARPDHHRRRGRAGARRLRGRRNRDPVRRHRRLGLAGDAADGPSSRWRSAALWVGLAGLPALRARRQRDDLVAAAVLHRHRDHAVLRRGAAARPGPDRQGLDAADRRRLCGRQDARAQRALGLRGRRSWSPSCSAS